MKATNCHLPPSSFGRAFLFVAVAAVAWAEATFSPPLFFTNLAGVTDIASTDGPANIARFSHPSGVAVDGAGNVFVADLWNHTVRKITPAGLVTTLAGAAGQKGSADGIGHAARFSSPQAVAVDASGNIFVADGWNCTIRKITVDGTVTTLAGKVEKFGYTDGAGSDAGFYFPEGLAVDSAGNIYIADAGNCMIRKLTVAGVVTTLAGAPGARGWLDSLGSAARFDAPIGVAVDGQGNVYVADAGNSVIRKITAAGVVTTLAGAAGLSGSADGTGSDARFCHPRSVSVDGTGNVYVADSENHTIRKITPAGVVTTVAGTASLSDLTDGPGRAARFFSPGGLVVDATGDVYVADGGNNKIRKVTAAGVVTTYAGAPGILDSADGPGDAAHFDGPGGLTVDAAGNVFVADGNHTIRKVTPLGVVTTLAGKSGFYGSIDGTGSAARFWGPRDVAVDPAGNVYVLDGVNSAIRKITTAGAVTTFVGVTGSGLTMDAAGNLFVAGNNEIRKIAVNGVVSIIFVGPSGTAWPAAPLFNPLDVAVDPQGNLYVADSVRTVSKITAAGVVTTLAGKSSYRTQLDPPVESVDGFGGDARFTSLAGVAVDAAGNVYVTDIDTVRKITPAGVVATLAGLAGSKGSADGAGSNARFNGAGGLAVDPSGNVYVADSNNGKIRKITAAGVVTTLAGSSGTAGSVDGTGSAARFSGPSGMTADESNNVYLADTYNSTIRIITPNGVVTTFAGKAGSLGSADGAGGDAKFNSPVGLAADGAGNIYAADTGNHTIRKITTSGVVTTYAGSPGMIGYANGAGSSARLALPQGVAADATGTVYVADSGNHAIRMITRDGVVTTLAGPTESAGGSASRNSTSGDGVTISAASTGNPSGSTDGPGRAARFNNPTSLAVDQAGNVCVADTDNHTIRKITAAGVVTTLAGSPGESGWVDGTGSTARFRFPAGLAMDRAGNLYVADTGNLTIRKISATGVVTSVSGLAGSTGWIDGTGRAARFDGTEGVTVDRSGNVYISCSSTDSNTIRKGELAGPPAITIQPQSQTVTPGSSVQLSVTAAAVPAPAYQWYVNGSPFSGATTNTLSFANARSTDAGDYTVVITNELGTVTSAKATLTVSAETSPPTRPASRGGGGAIEGRLVLGLLSLHLLRLRFVPRREARR